MKKKLPLIIISALLVLAIPVTFVSVGFGLPSVFADTYYGELSVMFNKLKNTKTKKIVFVGNSAVAFGINTDLVNGEIPGYNVVNMGLYGAIGTKTMLELSKTNISNGDVVVLCVEPYQQTSSLYFSATETWSAMDADMSMLNYLSKSVRGYMVGGFVGYTAEKVKYSSGAEKPMNTGVYSRASFKKGNEDTDYVTYDRPYNIMKGGYDNANLPSIDESVFGEGYLDYVNEYAAWVKKQNAEIYYGFTPVNSLSLGEDQQEKADKLYTYLSNKLQFPLLNNPSKYFLDYRYFYDNNVHLNNAGMVRYTDLLTEDLKLVLNIHTKNNIPLLDPPEIPKEETKDGDNKDVDKFNYEVVEGATERYVRITGLNEEGKNASSLTIPATYEGLPVREFAKETFQDNKVISRLTLSSNIQTIYDHSFKGASRLSSLFFEHNSILGINVGINYLDGADNCYIYIKKSVSIADCAGGWERYQSRIRYY